MKISLKKIKNFRLTNKQVLMVLIADAVMLAMVAFLYVFLPKPQEVQGLSVTGSTYKTVDLSWKDAKNAKGYRVYRSEDGKKFEYMGSTGDNKFTDYTVRTGTQYYYTVSARNGINVEDQNVEESVDATPALGTPELSIDTSKGEMELNYTKVDGALNYEIIRDGESIGTTMETSYVDPEAADDAAHTYEVKAVRYVKDPVYSEASNAGEAELHNIPNFKVETDNSDLIVDWDSSDYYSKYKIYNGDEVVEETEDTVYKIADFEPDHTYDIKVVGYSEDDSTQSPVRARRFQVVEEPMTNEDAKQAAVDWGIKIANDDSFTYGSGQTAHRMGCYFCGTNIWKKGKRYEKTYCCNPFVHACYAHGAGDPAMLAACQKAHGVGMYLNTYTRYGCWESVGKPSISNLQVGDVLVRQDHVMLYIGDGQIVHAIKEGWGPDGIRTDSASRFYGPVKFVVRYTGTGRGVMEKIRDIDDDGNMVDENGAILKTAEELKKQEAEKAAEKAKEEKAEEGSGDTAA